MLILAVPLLVVLLLVAGLAGLFRGHRWVCACLILTALILNYCTQTYPLHLLPTDPSAHGSTAPLQTATSDASDPLRLRVMTYNIGIRNPLFAAGGTGIDDFMTFVRQTDADLLVLPEARMVDKPELHRRLSEVYPYNSSDTYAGSPGYIETWIYSRYPLRGVRQPASLRYIYLADVVLPTRQPLRLAACHLASNQSHSSLTGGAGFWRNLTAGYRQRLQDVRTLCDTLTADPDTPSAIDNLPDATPLLICGDLNDLSGSAALRTLQQRLGLRDAWWTGGCGYGSTFSGKHLYFRLDHILYSRPLQLASVHVSRRPWSDHHPLTAEFILPQE